MSDWGLYQKGLDYNNRLSPPYYNTIDTNIAMYSGDQWRGVKANGLPTPVFNMFKRIIDHQIASITSQDTSIQVVGDNLPEVADIISAYFDKLWEHSKMSAKVRELLLDGALTGDYCIYTEWDEDYDTGQRMGIDPETGEPVKVMGEIKNTIIDGVNVFFGNPNDRKINEHGRPVQPYIIVAFRAMTADVKEEAERNGENPDAIVSDDEYTYQAGTRGKVELDDSTKTTVIVKMWPKDGTIWARKSTRGGVVRDEWDTGRTLYPVAWGNWGLIKNSYHGQALGTGLTPNQIYINKLFAMAMISVMNTAYPRLIYDKSRLNKPSNAVGAAYGVEGDITGAAKYLDGGQMSPQVMQLIDNAISYTKEMLGASDAAMGDVRPDNTSAIIAVQQAAAIPLETIKANMYQFIEDVGYIWLDSMMTYYGEREITAEIMGENASVALDFASLRDYKLRLKVDVGASSYWSEIVSQQTLDNLLASDRITMLQYLERLPAGAINKKQELINELEEEAQEMPPEEMEALAQKFESLPPEQQQQLQSLGDEEMYRQLTLM